MTIQILHGDCREVLKTLPAESVQCCITSPPYFNLRDYGTATWDGGDAACDHSAAKVKTRFDYGFSDASRKQPTNKGSDVPQYGKECPCGAVRVDGQIGLEQTPAEYVTALVEVFRQVRRVLRPDGVVWLNLGDSFSSSAVGTFNGGSDILKGRDLSGHVGKRSTVGPNLANALDGIVKGQPLIFGNAATIGITCKGGDVPLHDNGFPYRVFLSLLGIERITIKQRDNDFCQVLHTLASPSYCWISAPVAWASRNVTDLEIVLDAVDGISVVIADHDANTQTVLGIFGASRHGARVGGNSSLTIEESAKPITEVIADGQTIGDALTFDTPLERFPDIYFVDEPVTLRDRLDAPASYGSNFRVTSASQQQVTFSLGTLDIRSISVGHLFAPNTFGSFVSYAELYDKAKRIANAQRPKQELGIPEMVKRALMEDGWICRSTIIWSKPNCMPESVTDRPTRSHEYIFLLTKAERYYMDMDAIAEPSLQPVGVATLTAQHKRGVLQDLSSSRLGTNQGAPTRNKRTVWTIPTAPYPGAHFATWPEKLVELMVLAGSSPQACECCGAPWKRVVERTASEPQRENYHATGHVDRHRGGAGRPGGYYPEMPVTTGWQPTCSCPNVGAARSVVLDPFFGSGTTGRVAIKHGRDCIGIELSEEYIREQAEARTNGVQTSLVSLI